MNKNYSRIVQLVTMFGLLSVAVGAGPSTSESSGASREQLFASNSLPVSFASATRASSGEYYLVRRDMRRCASPLCGGYYLKRANQPLTRCLDRKWKAECYVAVIDWNGQTEVEPNKALLRGVIVTRQFTRFGNLGALRVSESWQGPSESLATGTFYRVSDRGLRCITHPCLTHSAAKLNSSLVQNIAGVDLSAAGTDTGETAAAMTRADGVIVAGDLAPVTGPGGKAQTLKASKFFLRGAGQVGGTPEPSSKPCIKTGCSSQVCSDENVITTCEYKEEYACYQKAACERQKSGKCAFTMTPELRSCLERARRSSQ